MKSFTQQDRTCSDVFADLSKVTLTSLALLGLFGCSTNRTLPEALQSLPRVTPNEIINNPNEWSGKEVIISGTPILKSEDAKLKISGGKYTSAYLSLKAEYLLSDKDESSITIIDCNEYNINGDWIDLKDPAASTRLKPQEYIVSGTVKKNPGNGELFIQMQQAWQSAIDTTQVR